MIRKLLDKLHRLAYISVLLIIYIFAKLLFKLEVKGKENIPDKTDDLLIVSTHNSYWDPPLIGISFGPRYHIHFIARKGLLTNPLLSLPVKVFSTTIDRDNFGKEDLIKILKAFKRDGLICIFPEGTTSENAPPKSGTIRLAEKTNRKFLPLKIVIRRSPLEFPFFFTPAKLIIGKPINLAELKESSLDSTRRSSNGQTDLDYQELSTRLMEKIYQL
ncbi:1-acyl-sn-glycerol-3-phosphate acyltransferase [Candidatus Bipolaricaulota bacterium]|nr:1-acyl-sn-glycerol-3-phosphate acyltransferase [Candidatus Bipolaricaulota bacterium]MBS3813984.1 1-acyl-sn-glycerol-3-phosphate acyltransferase [Candidatus Bipolaricaulota bacterium]MBS3825115.1 1-acyl-sn-glycerol-3-phosphate acyltransferase [Candidatus Bipolaricaulota bacterium]